MVPLEVISTISADAKEILTSKISSQNQQRHVGKPANVYSRTVESGDARDADAA
jgi:hypothetical protein